MIASLFSDAQCIRKRALIFLWLALYAIAIALLLTPLESARAAGTELPQGEFVARVYYNQPGDLAGLAEYDVHEYNNLKEKYVRVSANREIFERLQGGRLAGRGRSGSNLGDVSVGQTTCFPWRLPNG